ncbi:MAG: hypothetical protein IT388_07990 [Nitrospirales bacterium]|nr:hypothetical protein [Nitrospirales bacterium]
MAARERYDCRWCIGTMMACSPSGGNTLQRRGYGMGLEERIKSLIAIGASVTSNCQE